MKRKYVIVVPDGAADIGIPDFDGKTIFEAANKPNIDYLAINGKLGLCRTVPPGLQAGSDVAMMSVIGYDPKKYYSGRAPIEAVAQGIDLLDDDWIFRCNIVTIKDEKMADHSAGHISSEEGKLLVEELNKNFGSDRIKFYPGIGYRHIMVIKGADYSNLSTQPPHDMIGKPISEIKPNGKNADIINDLITRSRQLFKDHPVNQARKEDGKGEASSIWLWGQGQRAKMEPFDIKYGLKGAAITAVDLVKGLAKLVGFSWIKVEGATGYFDTNYKAKGLAAIEALKNFDLILVHIEAPDEAGHAGDSGIKKNAVEEIDAKIVGPVFNELKKYGSYRMLVMPDHPTPVSTRGHSGDPIPFAMAGEGIQAGMRLPFSEANAAKTGLMIPNGDELMKMFLS